MRNETMMSTLDDFAAFLDEAEHPAILFPACFQMSGQKPEEMISSLNSLIDHVKEPLFYIARGHAHQSVASYDAAIADYDRFLTDGSADLPAFPFAMAHFQKGTCYLSLEDHEKAKRAFETAIDLNPHVSDHYRGHALALLGMGDPNAAWKTMGDAIGTAKDKAEETEMRAQRFSALATQLPDYIERMLVDTTFADEMRADIQAVARALDEGTAPPGITAIPGIREMIEEFQSLSSL